MANKKVTELPTNTSPSGAEVYAVEGGLDYRIPIGGNNGLSFLGATGLVPTANLGTGTADGTTYLRGDGTWATVAGGGAGTVTSVAVANATGISWTGSPITGAGTLTPTLSANLQAWSGLATSDKANTSHTHHVNDLTATGTKDSTTYLRGDNTWAVPAGGGGGSGTVTSVQVSGGTTGLSYSGGPVTTSGTITLAGTLAIANGGTGAASAAAALGTLGAAAASHTHAAADITSGIIATARLGSGTANSTTYLRGDGTYATPPGGGGSGTVTSITISGSTGLTVGGDNPITTSGTTSLTLSANLQSWSAITPASKADASHVHSGADITSGTVGTARLGSGTANSTTFLRGDGTWQAVGGSGTVTSVSVSGGTTGLTFSGGPVTTAGTVTAAGTLGVANGGTNLTTYTTGSFLYASGTTTIATRTPAQVLTDIAGAPLASPTFTGTVTLPGGSSATSGGKYLSGGGVFSSTGASAIFSTSTAGTVYFRPNGDGTSTGQLTLSSTGAVTIAGSVTSSSDIICGSGSVFRSSGADAYLGNDAPGNVYLRPNTSGSATGQFRVASDGRVFGSGGEFNGTGGTVMLATTSAGTVYLRPSGYASATGQLTIDSAGVISAGGAYTSSGTTAILATTGAGNLYLRPNGAASTTGQVALSSSGVMTFLEEPLITNADGTGTVRIPRTFVQSGDPGADSEDGDLWIW